MTEATSGGKSMTYSVDANGESDYLWWENTRFMSHSYRKRYPQYVKYLK